MNASPSSSSAVDTRKKRRKAIFLAVFLPGFLLTWLYSLALIESKYSVFLHLQPFRTGRPMTLLETAVFLVLFSVELLALLLGFSLLLWWLYERLFIAGRRIAAWLIPFLVLVSYALAITLQFQVLRYFKDGLDLMLARQLGGGDLMSALHYGIEELGNLLPTLAIGILLSVIALVIVVRYGSRFPEFLANMKGFSHWLNPKYLLLINLFSLISAFATAFYLPVLDKNLGYSLAHHLYLSPWSKLTDFDGDGYGMIPPPADQAPFDASRHPYALEIVHNGTDEDGVGGDLEENIWPVSDQQPWNGDLLSRRNVLLIVLESARADLYEAKYKGEWVMPNLRSLPGRKLNMVSHTAFTAPAIISIFNGTVSKKEQGRSLIERFSRLGYRIGVFSAQNEGFGGQDEKTAMKKADLFFDARSVSPDKRMYLSSSSIALSLPSPEVLIRAKAWISENDSRPFFAYLNLQELHFPYSYRGIPKLLLEQPIPRYSINEEEADWLRTSYYNAARVVDLAIADIVNFLKQHELFKETTILIVGDHGEELFDAGSLGHGTRISWEQNSPLGKLVNSGWYPPSETPVGLSEVPRVLHNALLKDSEESLPTKGYAIAFLGVRKPIQLGMFDANGLTRYDFRKDLWSFQPRYGSQDIHSEPLWRLIHLWESYLLVLSERD